MLNHRLFTLLSRLVSSRLARGYAEHHGACEVARVARLGPLHLEVTHCFVLDHDDARVSVRLPLPAWHNGRFTPTPLILSYTACIGADRIRQSGFAAAWLRPRRPAPPIDFDEPFPF